jgi:hypothetical protein
MLTGCSTLSSSEITLTATAYLSSDCTGWLQYPYDLAVPSGCTNGTILSCESAPVAIEEEYPAVGVYVSDATCKTPSLLVASPPGCRPLAAPEGLDPALVYNYSLDGLEASVKLSCAAGSTYIDVSAYNGSSTCGNEAVGEASLATETCSELVPGTTLPNMDWVLELVMDTLEPYLGTVNLL